MAPVVLTAAPTVTSGRSRSRSDVLDIRRLGACLSLRSVSSEAAVADRRCGRTSTRCICWCRCPEGGAVRRARIGQELVEGFAVAPLHEDECLPRFRIANLRRVSCVPAERDDTAAVARDRFWRSPRVREVVLVVCDVEQVQRETLPGRPSKRQRADGAVRVVAGRSLARHVAGSEGGDGRLAAPALEATTMSVASWPRTTSGCG